MSRIRVVTNNNLVIVDIDIKTLVLNYLLSSRPKNWDIDSPLTVETRFTEGPGIEIEIIEKEDE